MQLEQLRQIVKMQNELNEATITDWINKGLDWDSAILVEVAEAIDSTDWKWWKAGETDLVNLKIEAIDILHFLISKALVQYQDEELVAKQLNDMASRLKPSTQPAKAWLKQVALYTLENKVTLAMQALLDLFMALEMDVSAIFEAYITKNLLNHYRQERGYKDAAANYPKIIDGEEDNLVFARLVKEHGSGVTDLAVLKELLFQKMDEAAGLA